MNYTFHVDGCEAVRPRRSRKACAECRKRKQRCHYQSRDSATSEACGACLQCSRRNVDCSFKDPISSPKSPEKLPECGSVHRESLSSTAHPHGSSNHPPPQTSRFIGHLNPEARLMVRTRPSSPGSDREERDHLGVWCRSPVPSQAVEPLSTAANSLQRYVNVIREFEIPDEMVCDALSNIYFDTVHHFIPLVDEVAFRRDRASGKLCISLLLAVLLAACRDSRARPYLRFPGPAGGSRERPLQTREFAQRIYTYLQSLLKAEAETDKVILIQVHALMSLHCEGPAGNEVASLNLFTAIHYLQVLGMHLPRADETDKSGRFSTIFWSMWSLDRLNAAYNGRPTIIHERDMANKSAFACSDDAERKRLAPFMVWLKLTNLLDKTISYYRPVAEPTCTGWEEGFPSFEEVLSVQDKDMPNNLMSVLEIYYHAVAILTSRFREWNPVTASNASSVRQALSTLRMLQMAEHMQLTELPALPIIPYTMTLCLTVTYRQCRECLASTVNRATGHLVAACTVLEDLASQWWTAEAMSKLGRQAIDKISRTGQKAFQGSTVPLADPGGGGPGARNSDERTSGLSGRTDYSSSTQEPLIIAPELQERTAVSPQASAPAQDGWEIQYATADGHRGDQESSIYDYLLLDSIPNLVYPEAGLKDCFFDDVRLYNGFGTAMQG